VHNRLEKRRQAMLAMPQMIQEWKEVRHLHVTFIDRSLTSIIERTWTWMEEVAKIEGYVPLMELFREVYNIMSNAYGRELSIIL